MKERLRELIAIGKTKEAILKLRSLADQINDSGVQQEIILQSSRYERFSMANRMGTSSSEEQGTSLAKINKALLEIVEQLPETITSSDSIKIEDSSPSIDKPPTGKMWKWIVALGLLIAISAGIAEISGYSLKKLFSSSSTASNTVTVLVHGKKGKDELVLPNRGIVKLIYGDAIVPKQINADGEATFKQVSDVFFDKDVEVEIVFLDPEGEPYRAALLDKKYKLTRGKYIPLEVHLFGLEKVSGIVKDFKTGNPIEGARISIQREESYSNKYGEFVLIIPEENQQKFQTIRVIHKDYAPFELSQVPIQTQSEIPILLKKK